MAAIDEPGEPPADGRRGVNTLWRVSSTLRRLVLRALNLFRSDGADRMADRELASHLALPEDEYRRRGLSPEAARGRRS
jgi:hypothetical protein